MSLLLCGLSLGRSGALYRDVNIHCGHFPRVMYLSIYPSLSSSESEENYQDPWNFKLP